MGLSPFSKSSFCKIEVPCAKCYAINARIQSGPVYMEGNPDPSNYTILKSKKVGRFLVVKIHYPDCNNYEGKKILVFENISVRTLKNQKHLDPHFCDHISHISPIARFVPSDNGWKYALQFCENQ